LDFSDTTEEAQFRRQAREWLQLNAPKDFNANEFDCSEDMAPFRNWQRKKAAAGWTCFTWPKEFGGRGGSPIEQVIWSQEEQELAYLSSPFIIGLGMGGATIMMHGSDELKNRYLPPMVSGDEVWCQLFSEPSAGSDLAGIKTKAVRDGDDWIINGQKIWTSYAHLADYGILITRTDPGAPKHQGLTYFIVDMKAPGVEVRPIKMASGDSGFNEVFLTDVRIPDSHRLGAVGGGWKVVVTTLMNERLSVGISFLMHFDELFEMASTLLSGGGPMIENHAVRDEIADWFVKSNGLKYTGYRMMTALSHGNTPGPEASITKLVLARGRQQLASFVLDLQDQAGILVDTDDSSDSVNFQRLFFTSIGERIAGGTDEILLNIIGERVLGLPPDLRIYKTVPFDEVSSAWPPG
jgi:alkylation response protein AidB-like acyl-CoA dehydrogenase